MPLKDFGEISWEEAKNAEVNKEVSKFEKSGWIIAIIVVLGLIFLISPLRSAVISDEQIIQRYKLTYDWLNRCDGSCPDNVNIRMLNENKDCESLEKFFYEYHTNYAVQWRIAIDDRATSLGCPNFPKDMKFIVEMTEQEEERIQQEREEAIAKEQNRLKQELANQLPRYQKSLRDGKIMGYASRVSQDPEDLNTMVITVTDAWTFSQYQKRLQIAQVFWQKWVNIRDPKNPDLSHVRLITREGRWVGGSPPDKAQPIWVYKDEDK